jgi:hypothetical protein
LIFLDLTRLSHPRRSHSLAFLDVIIHLAASWKLIDKTTGPINDFVFRQRGEKEGGPPRAEPLDAHEGYHLLSVAAGFALQLVPAV